MKKSNKIQKAERESLNIKDKLLEVLKVSTPEVFVEGMVIWDKVRLILGEHLETSSEKFNFTWAGKAGAVTNVLIPSKATLRPVENESVKFEKSENIFIEGDNLEVLKLLQKSYFEQIKMIYIDPPYNTGNDFVYKDDFRQPLKNYLEQSRQVDSAGNRLFTNTQASGRFHSDWLTMMYPRLKLAWNLLRHDGVIFISIDNNEIYHLKIILDEIFGEENFVGTIIWQTATDNNPTQIATEHEYILCFTKDKEEHDFWEIASEKGKIINDKYITLLKKIGNRPERIQEELRRWISVQTKNGNDLSGVSHYSYVDKKGVFYPGNSANTKPGGYMFDIKHPATKKVCKKPEYGYRWPSDTFEKAVKNGDVLWGEDENSIPKIKKRLDTATEQLKSFYYEDNRATTRELRTLFNGMKVFDNPKSIALIRRFMKFVMSTEDIILDFFAGSATTAHAVLAQNQEDNGNRKFIMVQIPEFTDYKSEAHKAGYETIANIAKERIRRVLKGYNGHKSMNDGFKVFKLDKSNYYDNLFEYDPDKSEEENDKAFKDYLNKTQRNPLSSKINEIDIIYENIIKEGLSLNAKIEEIKIGKNKVYIVSDTQRELYISLDGELSASAIETLTDTEYKEKVFICFDGALSDSDKANLTLNVTLKTI